MEFGLNDLRALSKLFISGDDGGYRSDSSDDERELKAKFVHPTGPGSIGVSKSEASDAKGESYCVKTKDKTGKIWTADEVEASSKNVALDMVNDPRPRPMYESYYSQAVCSEDIYLQMGNKTPCTSSCENYIVVIELPGEKYAGIKLDIKPELLVLRSPKYFLHLPLPHPVDPNAGSAKWDSDKEKLSVSLKLTRDLDFLNF